MKKILFIEDEYALQRALTKVFEEEGFKVLSALNGEDGIRVAKKELPDVVILDLILPRKNGFEVLKELKSDTATGHIPVIILSNVGETAEIGKATELGANAYLVKADYLLDEVVQKVKSFIQ